MKKLVNTRIPAEKATAFNPLSLPFIETTKVVEVVKSRPQSSRDWRETIKRQQASSASPKSQAKPVPTEEELSRQAQIKKAKEDAALEGYTEGLEKGREKGEAQGYQEGQAKAQREVKQLSQRVDAILVKLHKPMEVQQQALQSAVMNVAITIAQAVIQRELATPSVTLTHVVEQALKALPSGASNIRVHMHPADVECLQGLDLANGEAYQLVADPKCQPGDCRISTQQSSVDFSVSERFRQVIAHMFEQYANPELIQHYQPIELSTDNPQDEDLPSVDGAEE
jgi:flagellar assembly protein FliH